jgi:hypothetical protein
MRNPATLALADKTIHAQAQKKEAARHHCKRTKDIALDLKQQKHHQQEPEHYFRIVPLQTAQRTEKHDLKNY